MATKQKLLALVRQHLETQEVVLASVVGTYDSKIADQDTLRSGLLLAKDGRALFYVKKLGGFEIEPFPYDNVSSFEHGKSFMGHHVTLYASGNRVVVKWLQPTADFEPFLAMVKSRVNRKSASAASSLSQDQLVQTPESIFASLEQLGKLRDAGLLTKTEFSHQKQELLAHIRIRSHNPL